MCFRWLINVFGFEYLSSGSGILDVAGGKGELSFEFVNLNGITSTVFDPRPLEVNRFVRKLEFGYYHRNEILGSFNINFSENKIDDNYTSITREWIMPSHIRGFFNIALIREGDFVYPSILESEITYEEGCTEGLDVIWGLKGLSIAKETICRSCDVHTIYNIIYLSFNEYH